MLATVFSAQGLLIDTAALAAVALVGYLVCRRSRAARCRPRDAKLLDELARASLIAGQLETVASHLSTEAGDHSRGFAQFKSQLVRLQTAGAAPDWPQLRERADALVGASWRLATSLSLASDQLRHQQTQLSTFSSSRIDSTTGLHNRRALEEHLEALVALHADGKRRFGLAVFSVTGEPGESEAAGQTRLRLVARLLQECVREDDFVARYSDDEFVVIMPHTTLAGAAAFGERLLRRSAAYLRCPVWGGVVEAGAGEPADKLLSRADSALYSARAEGGSCLFQHTGAGVRRHERDTRLTGVATAAHGGDAELELDDLLVAAE